MGPHATAEREGKGHGDADGAKDKGDDGKGTDDKGKATAAGARGDHDGSARGRSCATATH